MTAPERIVLVGGPLDGDEHDVPARGRSYHDQMVGLLSYWLPLPPNWRDTGFVPEPAALWPPPPRQAGYGLLLDEFGQPSRDDAGRLRLAFRGLM